MNAPVWSSEENAGQKIAEEFIRTLEWLTDSPISIPWEETEWWRKWRRIVWRERLLAARKYDNIAKTNHTYLERFLEIYSEKLKDVNDLRNTMNARSEKAAIIYDDAMFKAELGFKTLTTNYTLFAISIAAASLVARLIL